MGTTKGQLKIAFNSGINDTLSTQPSPSMPPCLVVANASTVSQPQDATNAQVAVADESSESKSEEGTRATLVVANGSTGSESESSGLSGADTETQTLRVINGSTASSSLGDSSKEERDPSDSHCNQNDKPNATSVYPGINNNELRIGVPPDPSRETTLFPIGISVPGHGRLLRASSEMQGNTRMQSSRNPVFQGDSTSRYGVENGLRHDEFRPSSARGFISNEPRVSIDTRREEVRFAIVATAANEHRADDRRDQPLATPTHYLHNETNLSDAVGYETNAYVNRAFDETPRQEQSLPRSPAPGCEDPHLPFNRKESNQKRACSSKCLKVCLPIAAITAGLGLLALIVALSQTPQLFSTKATVQMRVDDTFADDMVNPSSETSLQYGDKFCYNVEDAIKDDLSMNNCSVTGLQKGSVIVDFEIRFVTTLKYTGHELEALIINSGIGNDLHTSFGLIQAFADSIKIMFLETSEISSEDSESEATPGDFDCSEKGEYSLPLPYTYPLYCGEYQLCAEGKSTARACEEGLEYGDSEGNTEAPCHQPSNSTYCGRKRFQENAKTTPTTSLSTSMEATTGTPALQTTKSMEETTETPAPQTTTSMEETTETPAPQTTTSMEATTETPAPQTTTSMEATTETPAPQTTTSMEETTETPAPQTTTSMEETTETPAPQTTTSMEATTETPAPQTTTSMNATTETPAPQTTTLMEMTTGTTSAQTTTGTVTASVSSNLIICSNIDPQILANSSSMYDCQNNSRRFVPSFDTYPNNCALFKWCDYPSQAFQCARGSVLLLRDQPCGTKGIDDTFCEQMERAEWCRNNGWTEATGQRTTESK
ncbi:mucin-22-like [Littorina saxatilis]|uniref:mucin-22-like n=1 Tax=Littorina saxatilis TaxID=31220 RepID=UPI0038B61369